LGPPRQLITRLGFVFASDALAEVGPLNSVLGNVIKRMKYGCNGEFEGELAWYGAAIQVRIKFLTENLTKHTSHSVTNFTNTLSRVKSTYRFEYTRVKAKITLH
jgi:hypothetical protein